MPSLREDRLSTDYGCAPAQVGSRRRKDHVDSVLDNFCRKSKGALMTVYCKLVSRVTYNFNSLVLADALSEAPVAVRQV